jgi:DNA-binding NtrC family response regulator
MRVGGTTKLEADVRLVCATLRPLEEEVKAGRFRADLLYRIQGITLRVPSLRERPADILPLIDQFAAQASARYGSTPPRLPRSVRSVLLAYPWPGNARELRNTIEMLCLLRAGKSARIHDLPDAMRAFHRGGEAIAGGNIADEITISLGESLDAMIDRILDAVLAREGGNRTRAAQRLGISVRTIQRHLGAVRAPDA